MSNKRSVSSPRLYGSMGFDFSLKLKYFYVPPCSSSPCLSSMESSSIWVWPRSMEYRWASHTSFWDIFTIHIFPVLLSVRAKFLLTLYFVAYSVYGPPEATSDACQAPARPDLPAACATAQSSPLHLRPAAVPGSAVDPQVHRGCHHLPCHGEFMVQFSLCLFQTGTKL